MGMSIEDAIRDLIYLRGCGIFPFNYGTDGKQLTIASDECIAVAVDSMRKYQMMQADYEARLKADMVAMLTEILLEAEENTVRWYVGRVDGKSDDVVLMETLQEIIQERIDKLKGVKK